MKEITTTPGDFAVALLVDFACLLPFLGNGLRIVLSEPLGVDYVEPKNTNDVLWGVGTVASFIPVATIITAKEKVKQLKGK